MARLIDDLRAPNARVQMPFFVAPYLERDWAAMAARLHPLIMNPDLPVIDINNVAKYLYEGTDQEYFDISTDFPNLAPPYPAFWCEHKLARHIHSKECGDTDVGALGLGKDARMGALVHGLTCDQFRAEGDVPDNVKWVLWFELYIDYGMRGHYPTGPSGSIFLSVDEHGALIGAPWMQSFARASQTDMMKSLMVWIHPTLLAISFLHCGNVRVEENRIPAALAKKHRARYGVQPVAYKTLVIEPLKQILRSEGRAGQVGLAKAMHICRGHFRDYREGRGLFGRYHKLVWTPSVVRGTRGGKAPAREIEVKL
jgi:hypothetical protein